MQQLPSGSSLQISHCCASLNGMNSLQLSQIVSSEETWLLHCASIWEPASVRRYAHRAEPALPTSRRESSPPRYKLAAVRPSMPLTAEGRTST